MRRLARLIEILCLLEGDWISSIKNGEPTEGRGFIVKCGETSFEGVCKNPMELSMCDGPLETVEYIW